MPRHAVVRATWDDEAKVWYVSKSDIPGLATEADTLEALRKKIPIIISDLLEGEQDLPHDIEVDLIAYAHDRVHIAA